MEEVICRFPHIGEQIFAELEDSSLAKCRETNRLWQDFINSETFYKKRIEAMIDKEIKSYEEDFDIPKGSLTPLHSAAIGGHLEVLRLFFETGVYMRQLYNGYTPLQLASENFHWRACRFLMENNWRNIAPCLMAAYNSRPDQYPQSEYARIFRIVLDVFTFLLAILLGSTLIKLCHGILTLLLS